MESCVYVTVMLKKKEQVELCVQPLRPEEKQNICGIERWRKVFAAIMISQKGKKEKQSKKKPSPPPKKKPPTQKLRKRERLGETLLKLS